MWRGGDEAGTAEQGIKILGTPLGHPDFVRNQLHHVREHQQMLLDRIPLIPDVQSSWCLLLHCAAARANYCIRVVPPELSDEFATSHDNALWMCLSRVLDIPPDACDRSARDVASLLLAFGGMGLRSAVRTAVSAYSSWGDALSMISQRHRTVATTLVHELSGHSTSAHLNAAAQSADQLRGLEGFVVPSWADLAAGVRPKMWNQLRSALDGSMKPQHVGNGSTVNALLSQFSATVHGPSCVHRVAQQRG